ncbi:hypothetical protein CEQ90_15270 [Lewinellaceae bacterium SD302]|nr:hypothetical protein CEQ90_15270 [Lewinellaceae bacterium SD302]
MFKRIFLREKVMLTIVVLNALLIYFMYFPAVHKSPAYIWLEYLDIVFLTIFLLEAIVKISHYGWEGYFDDYWNRFDLAIVVLSLPTFLVPFVDIPNTGVIIVLRLFRLIRIARVLRFVPNMHHILKGLGRAVKASVFVLFALAFLIFIFAIITCHFYGSMLPERFGDPLISIYSIFQLFTLEGWYEIPDAVAKKGGVGWMLGATRLYFGFIVLLGGVFGMSLANAVFVDEMTMDNNNKLEEKIDRLEAQIGELKEMLRK